MHVMSDGPAQGNETKDERVQDMNTPGFEPGTQWSEVEPLDQVHHPRNKRSVDLGALLDSWSWYDTGNFLQTCIKKSLLQTKSIEI